MSCLEKGSLAVIISGAVSSSKHSVFPPTIQHWFCGLIRRSRHLGRGQGAVMVGASGVLVCSMAALRVGRSPDQVWPLDVFSHQLGILTWLGTTPPDKGFGFPVSVDSSKVNCFISI